MDIKRLPSIPVVPGRWCLAESEHGLFRVPRPAARFFDLALTTSAEGALASLYGDGFEFRPGVAGKRPLPKQSPARESVAFSLTLGDFAQVFRRFSGREPTVAEAWELARTGRRYDGGVFEILEAALSSVVPADERTYAGWDDETDD